MISQCWCCGLVPSSDKPLPEPILNQINITPEVKTCVFRFCRCYVVCNRESLYWILLKQDMIMENVITAFKYHGFLREFKASPYESHMKFTLVILEHDFAPKPNIQDNQCQLIQHHFNMYIHVSMHTTCKWWWISHHPLSLETISHYQISGTRLQFLMIRTVRTDKWSNRAFAVTVVNSTVKHYAEKRTITGNDKDCRYHDDVMSLKIFPHHWGESTGELT